MIEKPVIEVMDPKAILDMKLSEIFQDIKHTFVISKDTAFNFYACDLAELEDILTDEDEYRIIRIDKEEV